MQGSPAPQPDQGLPDSPDVVTEEPTESQDSRLPDEPQAETPAPAQPKAPAPAEKAATTEDDAAKDDGPKGTAAQRRIDRLTRQRRDAEREAAYERGRREGLEAALARTQQAPATPAATRPKLDDFDSADDYADALADWKIQQKSAEDSKASPPPKGETATPREPAQAPKPAPGEGPSETAVKAYAAAKAKFPDLDEVLLDASIPFTKAMADALADDEDSAEVLYQLGQDPDEVERISKLEPLKQAREVWRFAEKYRAGTASQPATPAQPDPDGEDDGEEPRATEQPRAQVSKAGPVPPKLSGSSRGASSKSLEDLPQGEYERVRNEQERKRAR